MYIIIYIIIYNYYIYYYYIIHRRSFPRQARFNSLESVGVSVHALLHFVEQRRNGRGRGRRGRASVVFWEGQQKRDERGTGGYGLQELQQGTIERDVTGHVEN